MKFILPLVLGIFLAMPALAAYDGPTTGANVPVTGFKGPVSGSSASTVAEALKLPDKSRLSLTGNIVSRLAGSKNEYVFKDASGEIQVEISDKVFRRAGAEITPETNVRISGKMDKDFSGDPEIDVKHIEIIK